MIAVISADLIDSSSYSKKLLEQVLNALNEEFKMLQKNYKKSEFEIFRGDSFQGVLYELQDALRVSLLLKMRINSIYSEDKDTRAQVKPADLRLAIGIGTFDFKRKKISESNGEAFQHSGRTLDGMKASSRKIKLSTPNEEITNEFEASLFLLDIITEKWSIASAEVVYFLLKGMKEIEIAAELGISQSAVNHRKRVAGWEAVEVLLKRFEGVMLSNFK